MTNVRQAVGLAKFTRYGRNVYVNLDRITHTTDAPTSEGGTMIFFDGASGVGSHIVVDQTPAEVASIATGADFVAKVSK